MNKNLLSITAISLLLVNGTAFAKTLNLACMKTATENRENAYIAAWSTYTTTVKAAKEGRRDQLKSAWDITDERLRNDNIKTIEKNFKNTVRTAEKQRKNTEKSAKKTFQTAAKSCRQ